MNRLFHRIKSMVFGAEEIVETKAPENIGYRDPLDPIQMLGPEIPGVDKPPAPLDALRLPTAFNFPFAETNSTIAPESRPVMDSMVTSTNRQVMDAASLSSDVAAATYAGMGSGYSVPPALQDWYMRQSFIGYQACAMIAQQWLVDKACSMPGEDAVRHGWTINVTSQDGEQGENDEDLVNYLSECDKNFDASKHASEFNRFRNIFGIRVVLFEVDSMDPNYYENPFNPDGVRKGSYKGMRQIDPYWMMPMMTLESTGDPTNLNFYDPEYWVISGKRFHRSHLIIGRGPIVADIFKPMYIFGGIPLTQRIYERVYAAERTANEAPLLSMNKRTTAIKVNLQKAAANQTSFVQKLQSWMLYRDNYAVKVLGQDEEMQEFDTSLADFDSVIMNQYQLVAAISRVPATKLLGTSPKGFNATGEFEIKSYHEELESIQSNHIAPLLNRHHLLCMRSAGITNVETHVVFNPVDALTAEALANVNKTKMETDTGYVNLGVTSPDEVRTKIKEDPRSGYQHLSDEPAETEFGMSTENELEAQKAEGQAQRGEAAQTTAGAKAVEAGTTPQAAPHGAQQAQPAQPERDTDYAWENATPPQVPEAKESGVNAPATFPASPDQNRLIAEALQALAARLDLIDDALLKDGQDLAHDAIPPAGRSTSPSVQGAVRPSVLGSGHVVPEMPGYKLPKMKVQGLPLVIENPKGTIRQGQTLDGETWRTQMGHHYGYIKGIEGADGDGLDAFVGPNLQSPNVFVVNQNQSGTKDFDEHKVMLGFDTAEEAEKAYRDSFNRDWDGFGSMIPLTIDSFKTWISSGKVNTPLQENYIAQTQSALQTGEWQAKDGWVTVKPNGEENEGSHVLIGPNGEVLGGMGGKFNGENIGSVGKNKKSPETKSTTAATSNEKLKKAEEMKAFVEKMMAEARAEAEAAPAQAAKPKQEAKTETKPEVKKQTVTKAEAEIPKNGKISLKEAAGGKNWNAAKRGVDAVGKAVPAPSITGPETRAMQRYTGDAFYKINASLRGTLDKTTHAAAKKEIDSYVKDMDSVMNKSKTHEDVIVHRGIDAAGLKAFAHLKPGDSYVDPGFVSTSSDKGTALDFVRSHKAKGGLLEIRVPKGSKVYNADKVSYNDGENEMILNRGGKFKIISINTESSERNHYVLEYSNE